MKNWLEALFSETAFSVWWILSGLSTLSTFFFHGWADKARPALAVSAIVGFVWANFRVFQKQEALVLALRNASQLQETRASELRIAIDKGSRYILRPVPNVPNGDFNAMFLEFHLMIENRGSRNSIVDGFQIEVLELGRTFTRLAPQEGLTGIQGRHVMYAMNSQGILSKTGLIKIEADSATDRGRLIFHIPINLGTFAECNLRMVEPEFPPLHCRLTLTDTTQISATETFEMRAG
jgi:hypothetical protein